MRPYTLNVRGKLVEISRPLVMGVLNVTPDSFYAGSRYPDPSGAVDHAGQMLEEGASLIDIGALSSRPGSAEIPAQEEADRLLPVVEAVCGAFPEALVSVDTYRSAVAEPALQAGASIINDIYAGRADERLFDLAARYSCPYVLMHMQGQPATMQEDPQYGDLLTDILDFFTERVAAAREAGVKDVLLDPGFGFGKTLDQNYRLLRRLGVLESLGLPLLAGLSRKRMIAAVTGTGPEGALHGTTAANVLALLGGASILRVHDVRPAVDAVAVWEQYRMAQ